MGISKVILISLVMALVSLQGSFVSAASVRNVAVKNVGSKGRSRPFNNEGMFYHHPHCDGG